MRAPTIEQFRRSFGTWSPVTGKWKGDAYGYHPHGVIARPMVYTDHHNTSGHCDAQVMTDPDARFKPRGEGREASLGYSGLRPNPVPETGELVTVYRNGDWVGPDGPWRARMRSDMAAVLWQIRAIRRKQAEADNLARIERARLHTAQFESARRAFA